jgi:VWFA-related protein
MRARTPRPTAVVLVVALAALLLPAGSPIEAASKAQRKIIETLPQQYRDWLTLVDLLITKEELAAFLEIEKDYQRDAFIEQFWRQRDTYKSTARNEFRSRWERRFEYAMVEFGRADDDRVNMFLLNGEPAQRIPSDCTPLWPLEVWYYQAHQPEGPGFDLLLIFYKAFGDRYRIWDPGEGVASLTRFMTFINTVERIYDEIESSCIDSDVILGAINYIARQGTLDFNMRLADATDARFEPESAEWIATFDSFSTDVDEGATQFPARFEIAFPGRYQTRTVVQASVFIDTHEIGLSELGGAPTYNFMLVGEILRDDELFDNFQYQFNIPRDEAVHEELPLLFERKLRPGDYRVIVRLEDLNTGKVFRTVREVEIPYVESLAPTRPDDPETARLLAEANRALNTGDNTVEIVPPTGNLLAGLVRFNTLVSGPDVTTVEFTFDGRSLFRKRTPPYSVELDLGNLPRRRTLTAVAYDASGAEVARDELAINSGAHRFEIRLVEPRRGGSYSGSLRAVADVLVPEGRTVEKVEFYRDETLLATLFQPPWEHPILLPDGAEMGYIRAVAYQPDGNSTEDLVFINAPDYLEEVDVQFVELYITVTDKNSRPVTGLGESDFLVREDDVQQTPMRFDVVTNLPIHTGIVVDVSASMEPNIETAKQAALGFFEEVIGARDRATLITFNDHPNLTVKLTSDREEFARGLAGLKAHRGTALYDTVVFSLYYFNGVKGQRALVLLSDGRDESSRFTFEDTVEYARRAGIAIYAIGLAYQKADRADRKQLTQLAEETGGRSFFIDSADQLGGIYAAIQEELRSRYYLAYQSNSDAEEGAFRSIEVEVTRPGLEAKTLRGYYP